MYPLATPQVLDLANPVGGEWALQSLGWTMSPGPSAAVVDGRLQAITYEVGPSDGAMQLPDNGIGVD